MYRRVRGSPKVYRVPMYRNSTCWHTHSGKFSVLNHNFSIFKIHTISFFPKRLSPTCIGRACDTLNSNSPLLRSYYIKYENFFFGKWPILHVTASKSLPETTKAKLASSLHIAHQWWEWPHKVPGVLLAAELGSWGHILRKQFPGTPASVQSQEWA